MSEIDEELNNFIKFHQQHFPLEALVIWNNNYECIYSSEIVNKYLGITSLVGTNTYDFLPLKELGLEEAAQIRRKITRITKNSPCYHNFLVKTPYRDSYSIHQAMIFPILDNQKKVIAFCSKAHQLKHDMLMGELIRRIKHYNGYDFTNIPKISPDSFGERELIIIFLLIIGAKYKTIAEILSNIYNQHISEASVKVMMNRQIYPKFDTIINSELIITAISNGFLYDIPPKLVTKLPKVINICSVKDFYANYGMAM